MLDPKEGARSFHTNETAATRVLTFVFRLAAVYSFFGVLFGGIILVALIAVGAFFFIRRRRRRAMSDEVRFPGPGRTLAGAVTGGPRRKGWGKMGDDGGEETISGGRYGDDAFEMGGPNHCGSRFASHTTTAH